MIYGNLDFPVFRDSCCSSGCGLIQETDMATKRISRVSPKAYEYVKQVLDFGFHNAHSVGITGRLEREFAEHMGQK